MSGVRREGGERERASPAPALQTALLGSVLVGSALAIGAVHLPVLLALVPLVVAATVTAMKLPSRIPLPPPALVAVALALYTFAQSIPMPERWLEAIAPANADVWSRSLLPLGESPPWVSLSLDPGASCVEALKWLLYGCVFLCAARIAETKGAATVVALIFASAIAVAAVTIGHGLVGATKVWGVYQPSFFPPTWRIGPILNANNLAGYLNLGVLSGLGLATAKRPFIPRWIIAVGVALMIGTEVISASRGGLAALPLGVAFLGIALIRSRSRTSEVPRRSLWLVGGALLGGLALAFLGGQGAIWDELYDRNIEKLAVLARVKSMIREYPWLGLGRGAFESTFPAYRANGQNSVYTHAENFVAQWISEWGLLVGIAALIAFAVTLRPDRLWERRSPVVAGAVAGCAALLLQNLVDLALEIPAVSFALVAALGAAWGEVTPRRSRPPDGSSVRNDVWRSRVVLCSAAIFSLLAVLRGASSVSDDREALHDRYKAFDASARAAAELRSEVRAMMLRHPAEPYFPLVGATIAFLVRDQDPIPWLQRTLERSSFNARAHLLLARVLAARDAHTQALFEIRLAVEYEPLLAEASAELALKVAKGQEQLLRSIPDGPGGLALLDSLARRSTGPESFALRSKLDAVLLERDAKHVGARLRLARDIIVDIKSAGRECSESSGCMRQFEQHVTAIESRKDGRSTATVLRAEMMTARGRPEEAERLLAKECFRFEDRIGCLQARTEIAARLSKPKQLEAATRDLLSAACSTASGCATVAAFAGALRGQRGEWSAAASLYARAVREQPSEAHFMALGNAAANAGLYAQAIEAFERAAQKQATPDPELLKRIEDARAKSRPLLIPR